VETATALVERAVGKGIPQKSQRKMLPKTVKKIILFLVLLMLLYY